jgi:crotonobetainyl-CoA:carnitine CoA-transferase CaiB-like acyl-CoA transferase
MSFSLQQAQVLDDELSKRPLQLDEGGYFIIYVDREQHCICAKHFSNVINEKGLAVDPETGKPIPAKGKVNRNPVTVYQGRTAKELCIAIFETADCPVQKLDHAAYVGREAQRAERELFYDEKYIQD